MTTVQSFEPCAVADSPPAPERLTFPLSFQEQRLWFMDRLEPGMSVYNVPEAYRLKGHLVPSVLERSLNEIIRRHESLRTTFAEVDLQPVQVVAPSLTLSLPVQDLTHLPMDQREPEARRLVSDDANRPFDLEHGPLLRVTLLRLMEDEHVLLINMHHIISEGGWSMGVFLRELNVLYNSFAAGRHSPLRDLEIQYGDYAAWQKEWLQGSVQDELVAYWKKQLQGAPGLLELPSDRPRPTTQTYRGNRESRLLPAALKAALQQLSIHESVTLFMTLVAAFKVLLFRYTRQEDLLVGIPVAGRNSAETHDLIGFFVNTLVLRTNLGGDPTFRDLLKRVRQVCSEAHAHDDVPFEAIVEAVKPERTLAYSPLFQVMFAYQNAPREDLNLTGLVASPFDFEVRTSMFDLRLFLWERPDGLLATLEYSTDLFDQATMQRLLGHFEVLLEGVTAQPDQQISNLPLLSAAERHTLLVEWNATGATYPADTPLQELIEAQARQKPQEVAVADTERRLTYRELNARANQLAWHLRSLGVGPDVLVGVALPRSVDLIVALFAVVKAGGAYVPIDPDYPDGRISAVLEDSNLQILLAEQAIQERLPDYRGRIVSLDWKALSQNSPENLGVEVSPRNLAYVLYTSGSTGKPKGVLVPRGALLNLLWSMSCCFKLQPADVVLGVTTISFDIAGLEIWLPLLLGIRLILASRAAAADGAELQQLIDRHRVTFLQATPITWKLLLSAGWQGKSDLQALCGGEAMPRELARQLIPLVPHLWNVYGPTETTIWSTAFKVTSADHPILIGRPIANTQIYILDQNLAPVPIGVPGELYIGGAGVADGYLKRPDLTGQRFVSDPFRPQPARMYRTGDQARYRFDANIECLGRNDDQIKLRGFRIEPEEIRSALMQHPSVSDAVAVLNTSEDGEARIVAYVCAGPDREELIPSLRSVLEKSLPGYMVPSAFVFLDQMPLTPNGKIDRRALPAPDLQRSSAREFIAARDTRERRLTRIWEDVLKVSPIGIRDNYFDLGGYSILAVRLFSEIKKAFGIELPLAALYSAPTIESLAALLAKDGEPNLWSCLVPIRREGSKPPFYFVSGAGGGVLVFRDLGIHLGVDQPVYALQPKRPGKNESYPITISEMAAQYIQEILAFQPHGPYYLGGYSLGGFIAFEMAQQLTRAGHEIGFLGVFDANAPLQVVTSKTALLPQRTTGNRLSRLVEVLRSRDRFGIIKRRLERRVTWLQAAVARQFKRALPQELMTLEGSQLFAGLNYVGHPYGGSIILFRSTDRPPGEPWSYQLGWEKVVTGGIEVHEVPGDHLTIYSGASIGILAEKLKTCLARAQSSNQVATEPTDVETKLVELKQVETKVVETAETTEAQATYT